MAQVFISYSRKDELFAQRLAGALTERKRECWLDRKDIEFTADWKQRVLRGIEDANAFVCVVTPDYAASTVSADKAVVFLPVATGNVVWRTCLEPCYRTAK
jgi:hypothetical protein